MKGAKDRVLIVEDDKSLATILRLTLEERGFIVELCADGKTGSEKIAQGGFSAALLDLGLPGMTGLEILRGLPNPPGERPAVVVMTANGTVQTAVEAMKLGAVDYLVKPFDMDELVIVLERALEVRGLRAENVRLKRQLGDFFRPGDFIGESRVFLDAYAMLKQAAGTDVTVLLYGESGTGKEIAARAVHALSVRSGGPFVAINCAAIPESLMESELFGHMKGAFTGAIADHQGKLEQASGGTLFFDEIGEMPPAMQAKLLRAIQEREVERVGGIRPIPVDVRIVSATKVDLKEAVSRGRFREDLYFRINVLQVRMPSLRERKEDIPSLCRHILSKLGRADVALDADAMKVLDRYYWPGNVRELEHALERALVLLSGRPSIGADLFPDEVRQGGTPPAPFSLPEGGLVLEDLERRLIEQALERAEGNQTRAATLLGLTRATFIYRMEKYGLGGRGDSSPG